jgi:hypothetical protein
MLHNSWFGPAAFTVLLLLPIESAGAAPLTSAPNIVEFDPATTAVGEDNVPLLAMAPVGEQRPAMGESDLGEMRGGQSVVVANQTMSAITAGNSIFGDSNAGAVNVSDNALSNFNGLGNIMINTGSQVNLQSGMNITINLHP